MLQINEMKANTKGGNNRCATGGDTNVDIEIGHF